jgi:signal transduction histidine kinase
MIMVSRRLESHLSDLHPAMISRSHEKPTGRSCLGPSIENDILVAAQEALMNIARHAHAEYVNLSLRQEDGRSA